jgi:hypothetical protein
MVISFKGKHKNMEWQQNKKSASGHTTYWKKETQIALT